MKKLEKGMLVNFLYNHIENDISKSVLNDTYQELLYNDIIPTFYKELDLYEIQDSYLEDLHQEIKAFSDVSKCFVDMIAEYRQTLQNVDRRNIEAQRNLQSSILPEKNEVRVIEKKVALKYKDFLEEIYKRYLYFEYVMFGVRKEKKHKKHYAKELRPWISFMHESLDFKGILKGLRECRPWYIYLEKKNGITSYELEYVQGSALPGWWYFFDGVVQYTQWLWGNGHQENLIFNQKHVKYWGRGNICNFSPENVLDVINAEVSDKIGIGKASIEDERNPIRIISNYVDDDMYFCVSPERFLTILNKRANNDFVKKYKGSKCLICGRNIASGSFCYYDLTQYRMR